MGNVQSHFVSGTSFLVCSLFVPVPIIALPTESPVYFPSAPFRDY